MERKILHVDMDAFYASVEQRDCKDYLGKPLVVGGRPGTRGVVSAASYEAREYGIHSAMPISEAYKRCPTAIFVPPNIAKYSKVSKVIMSIFKEYTPLVEPLSLDEAFLDVSGTEKLFGSPEKIALDIKQKIKIKLQLNCSIGIASNKFLAKVASDLEKPDGLVIINRDEIKSKLWPLAVEKLWGIGKRTNERLRKLNIRTIGDLANTDSELIYRRLGNQGVKYQKIAWGIDYRSVNPIRDAKSVGHEITFGTDVGDKERLINTLVKLAEAVGLRLRHERLKGKTITLKLRYDDFVTINRSHTLNEETNRDDIILRESIKLFRDNFKKGKFLRLMGLTLSGLKNVESPKQISIFEEDNKKADDLYKTLDKINYKYGRGTITRASLIRKKH